MGVEWELCRKSQAVWFAARQPRRTVNSAVGIIRDGREKARERAFKQKQTRLCSLIPIQTECLQVSGEPNINIYLIRQHLSACVDFYLHIEV